MSVGEPQRKMSFIIVTIHAQGFEDEVNRVTNFGKMLNDAKTRTGLLKSRDGFSELFQ